MPCRADCDKAERFVEFLVESEGLIEGEVTLMARGTITIENGDTVDHHFHAEPPVLLERPRFVVAPGQTVTVRTIAPRFALCGKLVDTTGIRTHHGINVCSLKQGVVP